MPVVIAVVRSTEQSAFTCSGVAKKAALVLDKKTPLLRKMPEGTKDSKETKEVKDTKEIEPQMAEKVQKMVEYIRQ